MQEVMAPYVFQLNCNSSSKKVGLGALSPDFSRMPLICGFSNTLVASCSGLEKSKLQPFCLSYLSFRTFAPRYDSLAVMCQQGWQQAPCLTLERSSKNTRAIIMRWNVRFYGSTFGLRQEAAAQILQRTRT
jgi:hypothetical protein